MEKKMLIATYTNSVGETIYIKKTSKKYYVHLNSANGSILAEGSFRKIRDGEIVVGYIGNMPVTMNTLLDMNSVGLR
jgi:hypothetical protein